MEYRVEDVVLGGEVTLDIRALMEYSSQGKCRSVKCLGDTEALYKDQLRPWATSSNWFVSCDEYEDFFFIFRT